VALATLRTYLNLRFQLASFVFELYVSVCFVLTHSKGLCVHWHNVLSREEPKAQLIENGLHLRWLDNVFLLGVGVVLDTDLLIAFAANRDRELKLASNFAEVLRLWV